jgi:hypothetical protein
MKNIRRAALEEVGPMYRWTKMGLGLVLALLGTTAACSDAGEPLSSTARYTPMASVSQPNLVYGRFVNPQGNGVSCDPTGAPDEGTGTKIQSAVWIEKEGGEVYITGQDSVGNQIAHILSVPRNAVRERTLFCMKVNGGPNDNGNQMILRFKAYSISRKGVITNVGKDGFREPVTLYMNNAMVRVPDGLGGVRPLTPEEKLRLYVFYDPENNTDAYERTKSGSLAPYGYADYVYAELLHFSKYAMGMD